MPGPVQNMWNYQSLVIISHFVHSFQHHNKHGVFSKHVTLPGINFPMEDAAVEKLEEVRDKQISYVQLVCMQCIIFH